MMRDAAKTFQDLEVWRKSHAAVLEVYKVTRRLPKEELFGLVSQMRRAAVSVPANIAERFKRRGKADKARQLNIAQGSLEELRYFFILCADLSYLPAKTMDEPLEEISACWSRTRKGFGTPASRFPILDSDF